MLQRDFERMEAAKMWSEKLDIPGFIQACATTTITFWEWVGIDDPFYKKYGLPTMFKEALKRESKRVVDDTNRKREDEINRIKMDKQSYNAHSTISQNNSVLDKTFNSR